MSSARRVLVGTLTFLVALTSLLVAATVTASAAVAPVEQRPSTGVTADGLPTVQINGVVWDQEVVGDTVYAGGQFTSARPAGSPAGTNETPRSNILAYNIRTGELITSFAPSINGVVKDITASPDGTRIYVGGNFTSVSGVARYRLAAFNTANGALVTTFAAGVNAGVNGIAVSGTTVYVGGAFTSVGSNSRPHLAAFNASNGATLGWAPTVDDGSVNALVLTPDKSKLIVAGSFGSVNGSTATGLAAVNSASGALEPWAANQVVRNYGASAAMLSLSTDGTNIYSAGYWFGGTGNFEGALAADPNTGAIKWLADCHGDTYDVGAAAGAVYAVSHWHYCSNIGGFPDTNPRNQWYRSNAMTADAKGTVAPNGQGGYADFQGYGAPAMINWFPTMDIGTFTGQSQAGWTTEGTSQYLVQGGEFLKVNGVPQQGLVRFAIPSLAPKKQGPRLSGADQNPSLLNLGNGSVRVKWQTNWDRDDQVLSYEVQRQGTATPIYTTTATSQFWNRPFLSFTDTGTKAGTSYSYRISAFDPDGNRVNSSYVSITPTASSSAYVSQVIADGAIDYWRMGNTGGYPDYVGDLDLAAGSGTSTTSGAIAGDTDGAATFDGTSNGTAGAPTTTTSPDTFTAEAWFKTTSTSGGKILGFGDSQLSQSSSYDRQIYMDNAGRLLFGVYPGAVRTVQSSAAYNDGQWHHVAAQLSGAGMALYVDGLKVSANASVTSGQPFTGRWRVGGDNLGGWTNQPTSYFFAGSIDDVAIYPKALTAAQLRDHYTKSGRTVAVPAAPTDAYGKAVYADDPTLFWRLDDASGATARDASANQQDGQFAGGVSYAQSSPVSGTGGAAIGFNGADATIASKSQFTNPTTYSQELWFNTTTTSGGKLIGLGNTQSGTSSNYDRHVYMEASGQLTFGVWTGSAATITSPSSYNDGKWHQVVSTQSSAGMRLYVDGVLVGSNGESRAQDYSGYWRVGGDTSWCCQPWFNGSIDEVAVYDAALTPTQVSAHYNASPAAAGGPVNAKPVADFTASCADLTCTVDGSGSTDSDGTVTSYSWDFGDGTPAVAGRVPAAHTYAASGSYSITLTVTDDGGATSTKTSTVTAAEPANQAPTAAFTNACSELSCTFDGTGSGDSDGTVTGYAWDFGDASTGSGATPSHAYSTPGTYTVKLTVTDNRGGTDSTSRTVTVTRLVNQPPVASFTSDCSTLSCTFDASASSDPDGTLTSRTWDFGDGTTGTGATASHTYGAAGSYEVTLTVTDNGGSSTSKTATVTVAAAPNQDPTSSFTSTVSGSTVSFDASASTDADGTVTAYAWTFGDGTNGTGRTTTRTYAAAGTYSVQLTVTDDDGATSSVTRSVTVAPQGNTPLVSDAFNRTTTRWGNADTGGTYTYSGTTFSTNGSTGNVRVATAGTGATASLATVSARDLNLTTDIAVDKLATGGGYQTTLITRKSGNNDYRMTLQHLSTGSVRLNLSRVANGTATSLRDVNIPTATYTPGSVLKVRFTVTGNGTTALAGKVWKEGTTEPATAQITASDSTAALQAAGSLSVYNYISGSATNAPVTWSLDNLLVTAN